LALLSILAFGGIGLSVASGIMLIMPSTNRQSEPTGDQ
jgi:hypothetical protein